MVRRATFIARLNRARRLMCFCLPTWFFPTSWWMKNWLHPNYDVVGIPDGQQALTLLEDTTFDLIILDLDMPSLDDARGN